MPSAAALVPLPMDETTPPVTKIYLVSLIYTPKDRNNAPAFTTSRNRGRESGGGEARGHPLPQPSTPANLHGSLSYAFWRQNETARSSNAAPHNPDLARCSHARGFSDSLPHTLG